MSKANPVIDLQYTEDGKTAEVNLSPSHMLKPMSKIRVQMHSQSW